MRIGGTRIDGAVYLHMGSGMSCILRGDTISPAVDHTEIDRLGPWVEPTDQGFERRRVLQAKADLARVTPLARFALSDEDLLRHRASVHPNPDVRSGYQKLNADTPLDAVNISVDELLVLCEAFNLDKNALGHGSDPKDERGDGDAKAEKSGGGEQKGGFLSRLKEKVKKAIEGTPEQQKEWAAASAARQAEVDAKGSGPTLTERMQGGLKSGVHTKFGKVKV